MVAFLLATFVKDVKPVPGEVVTFRVQLPHGVRYEVSCGACTYREATAEGVRYLLFTVKDTDRVSVRFPDVKGRPPASIGERTHAFLYSTENPHPEWVKVPVYKVPLPEDPFSRAEVWVKVKLVRAGVYEITYDMLRDLGIDPTLYPISSFKMIAMLDTFPTPPDSATVWGREVRIWVDTAGRRILFWGEPMASYRVQDTSVLFFRHPYTDTSVYFLGLGGDEGKRIEVVRYPSGRAVRPIKAYRWEEERYNVGKKGRVWFGREMVRLATDPDRDFPDTFTLGDLDEERGALLLRSALATSEFSDVAYVRLSVNERVCDSVRLPPAQYRTLSCTPTVVRGTNDITYTILAVGMAQTVYLDYYEILYYSDGTYSNSGTFFVRDTGRGRITLTLRGNRPVFVWDVSDIYSPRILESYTYNDGFLTINDSIGASGWAKIYVSNFARRPISVEAYSPKGLRNLVVDYVAIGSERFKSTFSPFLNYRKGRMPRLEGGRWAFGSGTVAWVNLKDIYDEFGLGNPDPTAIRNFLYNMNLRSSGQQPLYVVLVGDGTYDYRGITSSYFPDGVPPFYYKDLSLSVNLESTGASDDYYVDFDGDRYGNVGIGRIPVRTEEELRDYLDKVREYEALRYDGAWRFRVMMVADDQYGSRKCEIVHTADVLYKVMPELPKWMVANPFLLQEYPFEGPTKPQATKDLLRAFNSGYLMVSFFIHGNPLQMAHEKLLTMEDVPRINVGGKHPFITVLSCKVGAYDRLDPAHVLGEELMLSRDRAIAVLSSTALSLATNNSSYAQAIYRYLREHGRASLGYLSIVGKNLEFYVLLGDPAVMLALPDSFGQVFTKEVFLARGKRNAAIGGGTGGFAAFDLPDKDTVVFRCDTDVVAYEYYRMRPTMFEGPSPSDTVQFWIPLRGRLSRPTYVSVGRGGVSIPVYEEPSEHALLVWWNGWSSRIGMYPITRVNPVLGTSKPKVKGFYAGDELRDGFRLPVRATLRFKFYSREGFDIRMTGRESSPPRIILDNSVADVLQARILNDTTAEASYTVDYSSDPGTHSVAVSVTSALGIRGYSVWDLNFVEDELAVKDLLAYPNPYRGGNLYLTFKLTKDAEAQVRLYTPTGRLIRAYDLGSLNAGFNSVPLDLPNLANGIYVMVVDVWNDNGSAKSFTRILVLK